MDAEKRDVATDAAKIGAVTTADGLNQSDGANWETFVKSLN